MTLAVKVALNPNTTNQPFLGSKIKVICRCGGQVSRSRFSEMAVTEALVAHNYSLLANAFIFLISKLKFVVL